MHVNKLLFKSKNAVSGAKGDGDKNMATFLRDGASEPNTARMQKEGTPRTGQTWRVGRLTEWWPHSKLLFHEACTQLKNALSGKDFGQMLQGNGTLTCSDHAEATAQLYQGSKGNGAKVFLNSTKDERPNLESGATILQVHPQILSHS